MAKIIDLWRAAWQMHLGGRRSRCAAYVQLAASGGRAAGSGPRGWRAADRAHRRPRRRLGDGGARACGWRRRSSRPGAHELHLRGAREAGAESRPAAIEGRPPHPRRPTAVAANLLPPCIAVAVCVACCRSHPRVRDGMSTTATATSARAHARTTARARPRASAAAARATATAAARPRAHPRASAAVATATATATVTAAARASRSRDRRGCRDSDRRQRSRDRRDRDSDRDRDRDRSGDRRDRSRDRRDRSREHAGGPPHGDRRPLRPQPARGRPACIQCACRRPLRHTARFDLTRPLSRHVTAPTPTSEHGPHVGLASVRPNDSMFPGPARRVVHTALVHTVHRPSGVGTRDCADSRGEIVSCIEYTGSCVAPGGRAERAPSVCVAGARSAAQRVARPGAPCGDCGVHAVSAHNIMRVCL